MLANVVLLWAYTLSCHSCRHIVGGRLRNFSRHPLRYKAWGFISKLNAKQMQLAWTTRCPVCGADATSLTAPRCPHDDSFVADVGVDAVLADARSLLAP